MDQDKRKQILVNLDPKEEKKDKNKQEKRESAQSAISVHEFLDFLKTAYQLHDNLEGVLMAEGMTDVIDWIKIKANELVKTDNDAGVGHAHGDDNEGATGKVSDVVRRLSDLEPLNDKLNEILTEGIADSVLPYLIPKTSVNNISVQRKPSGKSLDKITPCSSNSSTGGAGIRRKSSSGFSQKISKTDSDVEIHVCDEVKNVKKTFICNQQLLVEQMGYFADVTKDQKLDDMDISVHCDINIFDWLMRWIKRETMLEDDRPQLEVTNAVPILVSASFLQMEPLMQECLYFCHRSMNEILKSASGLSCLNDTILTRLADMYTNVEVELLRDRKDKIQSRLFCKLIQSLCEVEPQSLRGHYCSLAKVYRCKFCQQLVNPIYSAQIPCVPTCMRLQTDGTVINKHVRDPSWDINEFISGLYKSLKSWRKVYWKLWGCAHFLYCLVCKKYFPVRQENWCRFHPDHPQFFTLDASKPPLPVGRNPCCGERAYRFQLLDDRSGCCFRHHTISTKDIRDASIAGMLDTYRMLITDEPPQLVFPDRLTRLVAREITDGDDGKLESKETLWWEGIEIVPPRPKLGLIGLFSDRESSGGEDLEYSVSESSDEDESSNSSSTSSAGSEESVIVPNKRKQKKIVKKSGKKVGSKLWQNNLSARSNQDLQRAYEETAFKQMSTILNNKTLISSDDTKAAKSKSNIPLGGIWVRLENEWREKNAPGNKNSKPMLAGKSRMKTTRLL